MTIGGGGRRIDQVQTRRRRMKNARNMKVLYHYLHGIQAYNDEMMTFNDNQNSNRKLKVIDFLIDLQISIEKIEQNIILTEDGNLFQIETN